MVIESEITNFVTLKELEQGAVCLEISATDAQCTSIAKRLSIDSVNSFHGTITLEIPTQSHPIIGCMIVNAWGKARARLTQTCVVSLEQFEITQEFTFQGICVNNLSELELIEDEDTIFKLPEILASIEGDIIQVGEILIQQLALEVDQFPRRPKIKFTGYSTISAPSNNEKVTNPFAVLEKLNNNKH